MTQHMYLYGDVGIDITAGDVNLDLRNSDEMDLVVHLSSPGGDVYEGLAIMNAIRASDKETTIVVEGIAASIASVIAVGSGGRVVMRPSAEMMIHHAWGGFSGNHAELTKAAETLERISRSLADIYAEKSAGDADSWLLAMDAETWYTAEEAVLAGLADAVEDGKIKMLETSALMSGVLAKYEKRKDAKDVSMDFIKEIAARLGISEDADTSTVVAALDEVLNEQAETNVEVVTENNNDVVEDVVEDDKNTNDTNVVDEDTNDSDSSSSDSVDDSDTKDDEDVEDLEKEVEDDSVAFETVTLDKETYEELAAAAKLGWDALEDKKNQELESTVDSWIADGRVSASRRDSLVAAIKKDSDSTIAIFSKIPKGTIPRNELGYGEEITEEDTHETPNKGFMGLNGAPRI